MTIITFPKIINKSSCDLVSDLKYLRTETYDISGKINAIFSYRTHFSIKQDIETVKKFVCIEQQLNITNYFLTRFITKMQKGDYIQWTSKPKDAIIPSKLLLYSVTSGKIEFKSGMIELNAGQGILFCPTIEYRVPICEKEQIGITWAVPHWLSL